MIKVTFNKKFREVKKFVKNLHGVPVKKKHQKRNDYGTLRSMNDFEVDFPRSFSIRLSFGGFESLGT